jgi:hypothetical protein
MYIENLKEALQMNVTHMLYEYSCDLDFIRVLIEKGRTESALEEIEKLQKQVENDYITSLAQ